MGDNFTVTDVTGLRQWLTGWKSICWEKALKRGVFSTRSTMLKILVERHRGRQFYCYGCYGFKAMVDGVEEYLLGEGIEAGRIFYEKYDA